MPPEPTDAVDDDLNLPELTEEELLALAAEADDLDVIDDDEADAAALEGYYQEGGEPDAPPTDPAPKSLEEETAADTDEASHATGGDTGAAESDDETPPAGEKPPAGGGVDDAEERIRRMDGRLGALTDQLATIMREIREQRATPATAAAATPTDAEVKNAAADASGANWEHLKAEYPDWAAAIEERIGADNGHIQALQGTITQMRQQLEMMTEDRVSEKLDGWDWRKSIEQPTFRDWFNTVAPADIRAAGEGTDVNSFLTVMRAYDAHMANRTDDPVLAAYRASKAPAPSARPSGSRRAQQSALAAAADAPSARGGGRRGPTTEEEEIEWGYRHG